MAEMFTIAEQQNPDQLLENPYKLGDTPIETIAEGVEALREQEWVKVYNQVVDLIKKEKIERAKKKIEIAILINPKKGENYFTLANIFIQQKDTIKAITTINNGLKADSTFSMLYLIKADISLQNNDLKVAEESYLKAIKYSDDPGPIMRNLLYVYIDMGDNQRAIDYANQLLNKFPYDADIYYNVGVLYQRMARGIESSSKKKYNKLNEMDTPDPQLIREIYTDFKQLRIYANSAKDYFYEASDLEEEKNFDTQDAISEMKKSVKQMDDIYLDSIREIARSAGIELD
jgi:tetratricopeptide (TPR) repeat protein